MTTVSETLWSAYRYWQPDWYCSLIEAPAPNPLIDRREWRVLRKSEAAAVSRSQISELPGTIFLPGLVNAHTHLDLPGEPGRHALGPLSFADWIRRIILHRRESAETQGETTGQAVSSGLLELRRCGTWGVADISGWPWLSSNVDSSPPMRLTLFEQLGLDPAMTAAKTAALASRLRDFSAAESASGQLAGISPHAPYSMHEYLFEQAIGLAVETGVPTAMHVAESREELELLSSGTGRLGEVLDELGLRRAETRFPSILQCLNGLARCARALVIHANYLDEDQLNLIARHRDRISVVWCPRTHSWFGHSRWPLEEFQKRQINVALGTDSRASNPDLDLLGELQAVARLCPELAPRSVLKMGTVAAAAALGIDFVGDDKRSLPYGLTAFEFAGPLGSDPEAALVAADPARRTVLDRPSADFLQMS